METVRLGYEKLGQHHRRVGKTADVDHETLRELAEADPIADGQRPRVGVSQADKAKTRSRSCRLRSPFRGTWDHWMR
jgi:hypothetical protein